jgi:hypothetical protein
MSTLCMCVTVTMVTDIICYHGNSCLMSYVHGAHYVKVYALNLRVV